MKKIKFKAWDDEEKIMLEPVTIEWLMVSNLSAKASKFKLMQYTGLHDKNGVEIYEGDIVKYQDGSQISEVFYSDNEAQYKIKMLNGNEIGIHALSTFSKIFEVIGNIYENKELLNG